MRNIKPTKNKKWVTNKKHMQQC